MRRFFIVLTVLASVGLAVLPAWAQEDPYPPPEGPVEVLPTQIEGPPAGEPGLEPAPDEPEAPPAVGSTLSQTGITVVTWLVIAAALALVGAAVVMWSRRSSSGADGSG